MAKKYMARRKSPAARSNYRGTRLISNPNVLKDVSYNSAMSIGSKYKSRLKAVVMAGPARKRALRKILKRAG